MTQPDNMKPILRLLERLPVPVVIANPVTAEILWVNSKIVKMAAATHPDQIVGRTLLDFIQAPQLGRALADLARVALKQSPPSVTYQLRKYSGEYAAAQVASVPILYYNQLAMLSIVTDVSERETLVRELSESEERYRLLLESSPVGVTVAVDGVFQYANSAMARILGMEFPDEIIGHLTDDFTAEGSRTTVREARKKATLSGIVQADVPATMIRGDGSGVDVVVSLNRVRWNGEVATQATVQRVDADSPPSS